MNYSDAYLKFASEDEANSVLYRIEGAVEADPEQGIEAVEGTQVPNYQNIDVLGTLYAKPPADATEDYQPAPLDGWHVNVRVMESENATPLDPFRVNPDPNTPSRVWG